MVRSGPVPSPVRPGLLFCSGTFDDTGKHSGKFLFRRGSVEGARRHQNELEHLLPKMAAAIEHSLQSFLSRPGRLRPAQLRQLRRASRGRGGAIFPRTIKRVRRLW
jgi:hypothetical protein